MRLVFLLLCFSVEHIFESSKFRFVALAATIAFDLNSVCVYVFFSPAVPKTEPIGDTVRYVKEGSRVTLHCVISGAIDPPLYVIWYHGQQQIFPDNPRHWKTEVSHQDVHTNKLIKSGDENEALALSQQSMFDSRKTVSISTFRFIILCRFLFISSILLRNEFYSRFNSFVGFVIR